MKKLLDREPTEEMIKKLGFEGFEGTIAYDIFLKNYHKAFDAAPELKIDMEPIAFLAGMECRHDGGMDCKAWSEGEFTIPVYSATSVIGMMSKQEYEEYRKTNALIDRHADQVASLQAENERLNATIAAQAQQIVEQQARIEELSYWLGQMQRAAEEVKCGLLGVDKLLAEDDNLSALAAHDAKKRKEVLEEAAEWFAHGFLVPKEERLYISTVYKELRRMAQEGE